MAGESRRHMAGRWDWSTRLEAVLSDDGRNSDPLRRVLAGLSGIYGRLAALRVRRLLQRRARVRRLPRPVISVGNLTTGGTGKTPMTAHLAGLLLSWGWRPAILSRGYGGRAERRGAFVSLGAGPVVGAAVAGDEAYLLAQRLPRVPVIVGRDRHAMGLLAMSRLSPDCFILDDGFQHIRLHRDLNLALLDYSRPFGNGHLLPRGHLREPVAALRRADAIVLTRSDIGGRTDRGLNRYVAGKPVFRSAHRTILTQRWVAGRPEPVPADGRIAEGMRVYVFSGIADNAGFRQAVATLGGRVVGYRAFADHHPYSRGELAELQAAAVAAGARAMVTTAKDAVRLPRPFDGDRELLVADAEIVFADDRFARFVSKQLDPR